MQTLYLIRGVPGSGKSSLAKMIQYAEASNAEPIHIVEMDDWRMKDGVYTHTPDAETNAAIAIKCQDKTDRLLRDGQSVIVANTFLRAKQVAPYKLMALRYRIPCVTYICTGEFDNIHGVPPSIVAGMRRQLEL